MGIKIDACQAHVRYTPLTLTGHVCLCKRALSHFSRSIWTASENSKKLMILYTQMLVGLPLQPLRMGQCPVEAWLTNVQLAWLKAKAYPFLKKMVLPRNNTSDISLGRACCP
jgi:hypothetical protein